MGQSKLSLLVCSGLFACSGQYVSGPSDGADAGMAVDAGAPSALGGQGTSKGGRPASLPPDENPTSAGGATSAGGGGQGVGQAGQAVADASCGVSRGQPAALDAPIMNSKIWWTRLSRLIWADQPVAPPRVTPSINSERAGQIADAAIDQAIAETQGIPSAERFVRHWLQIERPKAVLAADWSRVLSQGVALEPLLNLRFDGSRVGAFTEPAFLLEQPTISRRGRVMTEALLGLQVPPEPPGFAPFVPPVGVTRRRGLAQVVSASQCAGCHSYLDPLGFSLENYRSDGNYVSVDAGQPVDASGSYPLPSSGRTLQFKDIADLGRQLTNTCDAEVALADHFLSFALQESGAQDSVPEAVEADRTRLRQAFISGGRSYRALIKAFAQGSAIRTL